MKPGEKVSKFFSSQYHGLISLGAHAPGGRVTALPPPGPKVSNHRYQSETPIGHRPAAPIGYSDAHSQHASQADLWFQRANRGISSNQTGILTLTCFVYEPNSDSKGKHILVNVSDIRRSKSGI